MDILQIYGKVFMMNLNSVFGKILIVIFMIMASIEPINAQKITANYDEAKVPVFDLPDPLVCLDGAKVESADTWKNKRRPEILSLFEMYVYGKAPEAPRKLDYEVISEGEALNGLAIRKQVTLYPLGKDTDFAMDVLIYLPQDAQKPVPAFLGLNFSGNQTTQDDPGIKINQNWMRNSEKYNVTDNKATEETRGTAKSRWPVEMIVKSGYAVATVYYGDIDPDFDDGFQNGLHPFFYKDEQTKPAPDEWGSIAAWSWGLSRTLDYFEKDAGIDQQKVAVIGHSRLGKTSLWAGATDERFAMVISNDSGCGGAALSRREFGETVKRINTSFPHWFCGNFKKYNDDVNSCPVDQHMLISLIAPRPVYIASATGDQWADPKGEFLSGVYADPVYRLLGTEGIPTREMPEADHPVKGAISYHIRTGGHDITAYDWEHYIDVANRYLKK
jgi:hypothetical protein